MMAAITWEAAVSLVAVALPITAALISRRPKNDGATRGDLIALEKRINNNLGILREDVRDLRKWMQDRY